MHIHSSQTWFQTLVLKIRANLIILVFDKYLAKIGFPALNYFKINNHQ